MEDEEEEDHLQQTPECLLLVAGRLIGGRKSLWVSEWSEWVSQ